MKPHRFVVPAEPGTRLLYLLKNEDRHVAGPLDLLPVIAWSVTIDEGCDWNDYVRAEPVVPFPSANDWVLVYPNGLAQIEGGETFSGICEALAWLREQQSVQESAS